MIDRTTRLRWRRRIRRGKRQVEDIGLQADEHFERHFFRRLGKLVLVQRFVFGWVTLIILLIVVVLLQTKALGNYYLTEKPAPGGIYTEGILGAYTTANPLYATDSVDSSVSHLIFSGLFKYSQSNKLVGDLATNYEADATGTHYTVHLRKNLTWQDGAPLTARDVVFTYKTIQNPDAKSPLASSWQGINVRAPDKYTVTFTLPDPLSSFPNSLTNGIIPEHLLQGIPPSQLRAINFDTVSPIGSGPYKLEAVDVSGTTPQTREEQVGLVPYTGYYGGVPKIGKFIIRSYHDRNQMIDSFKKQHLSAMVGLNTIPNELNSNITVHEYNVPLTSEAMVFFRTSQGILKDANVRKALVLGTNTDQIITGLGYPVVPAREPLLRDMIGYDKSLTQFAHDKSAAMNLLDQAGWKTGPGGIRQKNSIPLTFKLYSQNNSEYTYVTQALQNQWRQIGVKVQVVLQSDTDLQTTLTYHNYDTLLYGISIGVDPDVFAYWDSSQADIRSPNRLNFSEYRSTIADAALEAGRTRADSQLRTIKYKPFLEAWRNDAPALALYQPRFLYITSVPVAGFNPTTMNSGTDRFTNVQNWMIRERKAIK